MNAPPRPLLILASASPRRRELLNLLGVRHDCRPADLPEVPVPGETAETYVRRIAAEKSRAVQQVHGHAGPVLAADTEVVLGGRILGKPRDRAHGLSLLEQLSGRAHQVLSAVSLRLGEQHWEALSISEVRFRATSAAERAAYWATGEPRGKAGAYAIQGLGALFVEHLSGSYSGVMGLPLRETGDLLRRVGLDPLQATPEPPAPP